MSGWWNITVITGLAKTPIPTAEGMEISMVTFTDFATLLFTPSRWPWTKSLEIPGINAVAIAEAMAIGILEILVPLATALKSTDTAASPAFFTPIMTCW